MVLHTSLRHRVGLALLAALASSCGSSRTIPTFTVDGATGGESGSGVGSNSGGGGADAGSTGSGSGSQTASSGVGSGSSSGPITCSNPGTYVNNGGSCGTERWDIKTGTDQGAGGVSLQPQPNTIAALVALAPAGGGASRESPTETTLWELKDVTLTELKLESDSDEHLVISDGSKTMIVEVPFPSCASGSPWLCFITHVRSEIDARYTVTTSPQYPAAVMTIRGIGFFDTLHGQTGVAPNAIELHPVLQICFGQGCTPS